MDKSTESKISGPLLHWTKVMILNDTRVALEKSSRTANNHISMAMVHKESTSGWEQIVKINSTSLIQIAELIEKATEFIPEGMREWPSQN